MDLFDKNLKNFEYAPLADRLRPENFEQFMGQDDVVGRGRILRQIIDNDNLVSLIFWGPPGCGKTTLAKIIARKTNAEFIQFSAVTSGVKDLRLIIDKALQRLKFYQQKTIVFIDEIHRWNKLQQDALLPYVEAGQIVLIGATTENPSFEVNSALLSRCRVIVLKPLSDQEIYKLLKRAVKDKQFGLGSHKLAIEDDMLNFLASLSNGDARTALNTLEMVFKSQSKTKQVKITKDMIKQALQKSHLIYDKAGDEHYNLISALHKSMRGSNPNAALYWLGRMLEAGEDPKYIARRLIRFASEDIGIADSNALIQAVNAYTACHYLGLPESNVNLAQAVVYLAKTQKSNQLYTAYQKVQSDVQEYGNLSVPLHLRNAPTKLMKDLNYGKDYKYNPDYDGEVDQQYLPDQLKDRKYL